MAVANLSDVPIVRLRASSSVVAVHQASSSKNDVAVHQASLSIVPVQSMESGASAPSGNVARPSGSRGCSRGLTRQFSNLSVDDGASGDVSLDDPISSTEGEVELDDPVSFSDNDTDQFKRFVMGHPQPESEASLHGMLLQHAMTTAKQALKARPEAKRSKPKPKNKGKQNTKTKTLAKPAKRRKGAAAPSGLLFSKVSMHLGEKKSYIKSADDSGTPRCRWHLTPAVNADHRRLTEIMALAMKSSTHFGFEKVASILASIKSGLSTESALAMIRLISGGDVTGSEVDSECSSDVDDLSSANDSSDDNAT